MNAVAVVNAVTILIYYLLVYISKGNIKGISFLVFLYSCIQVYIIMRSVFCLTSFQYRIFD